MSVKQIDAKEAFVLLKNNPNSVLVDVRTFEEFNFVGFVNAASFNNRMILLPWQIFPQMNENPDFASSLDESMQEVFGEKSKDAEIVFLCRSGGRSNQAASYANNLGYKNCYNLTGGFEGELNENEQRGEISGWKASNLPWRQR